jgi:hypothetical protein
MCPTCLGALQDLEVVPLVVSFVSGSDYVRMLNTVEFRDNINPIVLQITEYDIGDVLFHVGSEGFDMIICAADFLDLQSSFRPDQNIVVQKSTS